MFKDRLDEGMARSIFDSERRLASMAVEQYRQLKDFKSRLQWGFKILDADVMAKEAAGGRKFDCEVGRKEVWDPTDCPTDWRGELIVKFSERMADVRRLIEQNGFTFKVDHKDDDPDFHSIEEKKTITIFGNGHAMSFSYDFWKIMQY